MQQELYTRDIQPKKNGSLADVTVKQGVPDSRLVMLNTLTFNSSPLQVIAIKV